MRAGLLSAGLAAIVIGGGAAQAGYSVTTLTDPNADGLTVASGINDTGEVVGYYKDSSNASVFHGFSYVNGAFTTLNFTLNGMSASSTSANGVSIVHGEVEIVGVYNDAGGARHGFVLTPAGYQSFDAPGGAGSTTGTGINTLGQLVGNFVDSTLTTRGFSANGVGGPPFAPIDPTLIVGGNGNLGVNDAGSVVGSYIDSGITHGFALIGTTMITLDDPLADGFTAATGINNAGDIVGYYVGADNATYGFIFINGTYTTIDVVIPNVPAATRVFGINDNGDLVGNYIDADGVFRGFVATPTVPEPGTLALLGVALAGTMIMRRRHKSDR